MSQVARGDAGPARDGDTGDLGVAQIDRTAGASPRRR